MHHDETRATPVSPVWYVALFAGTAGLAGAITLLFHVMRAVMDVGGACGSGGQYQIAVECPDGVPAGTLLAIFGGLASLALAGLATVRTKAPSVFLLAWPALFVSLGINFLRYGISPPDGSGTSVGLIVCGVVFELMGVAPLLLGLSVVKGRRHARRAAPAWPLEVASMPGAPAPWAPAPGSATVDDGDDPRLVERLQQLADLHRRGDLTDAEFIAAKRAVLSEDG